MTDFTNYTEVRTALLEFVTMEERKKLIYQWVYENKISYEIFCKLVYYI